MEGLSVVQFVQEDNPILADHVKLPLPKGTDALILQKEPELKPFLFRTPPGMKYWWRPQAYPGEGPCAELTGGEGDNP